MAHIPDMQNLPTKKVKNSILAVRGEGMDICQADKIHCPLPFIFLRIYLKNAGIRLFSPYGKKF
ncbi:hypothetical protein CLOBOL_04817 [Enterocloster bolteae ATCC BAA-613]|jgi:hypothetical protein|uniref:Uncharacterized protein n=1 Tax=Enterocloster bolteae (strain ATCC BAA-613 / DSM 15670 / CCUG 46953 / JCM 12243 / WAL 16351) TaxID=411902 RepID=A8RX77_ENTBW|nr:hypothetical protein CLOBOL_04817 [Enterocloster bolteae ATCC BAA-613]